ncbi:MAG TPA: hypothetical protein VMV45_07305, partial [Casimicrobiaceae bacterium]|nr:hypothetical protein [Casimicrobiaceae bacterium]
KAGDRVIVDNLVKVRPGIAVNAQLVQSAATAQGTQPASGGAYGTAPSAPPSTAASAGTGNATQPGVKPQEQRENAAPRGPSGSSPAGTNAAPK